MGTEDDDYRDTSWLVELAEQLATPAPMRPSSDRLRNVALSEADIDLLKSALSNKRADAEDLADRAMKQSVRFPQFAEHARLQREIAARCDELRARIELA